MQTEATYVLVVGGSLVGSSAALFLAQHRVPTILVERHAGSSRHPRAIGYTPRTLELLRSVGLGANIPAVPKDFRLLRARIESLAGKWLEESDWTPPRPDVAPKEFSPSLGAAIAQDVMEPMLRDKARELGAELRMSTELVHFEQDEGGVSALLRQRDGREYTIRAAYMIAADGGKSLVREALGIAQHGRGHMRTVRSVLFRAPLEQYLARGVHQFEIDQPDFKAFLTTYNDGRWVLMFSDDAERDETTLRAAIVRALGRDDLSIEIITTGRWELGALVAKQFRDGCVFLAGDAAHCLPPTRGGYGANTGIHDAHNLAWKLAAVHARTSTPSLLDSYDLERRPVAWVRHQQIFARNDYKAAGQGIADGVAILDDDAIEFGQLYRSRAVSGAGAELPDARRPDEWAGQPGTRAQHLWIERAGQRISTLDLFERGWVLLSEDARWNAAVARARDELGVRIDGVVVARDVQFTKATEFGAAFGVGASGASLIRPDGHVAWRTHDLPADPAAALLAALREVASSAR